MAEFGRQVHTLHRPLPYSGLPQSEKVVVEYIWIGGTGYDIRSKTRVFSKPEINSLEEITGWNYDGSSTGQAEGTHSEVSLRPRVMWKDPIRGGNNLLVLCDTFLSNGEPANSNFRVECQEIMDKAADEAPWFGFEQEYILFNTQVIPPWPIGFPAHGYPTPQGPYYCGVGAELVFGREISEAHLRLCLAAGLNISGTNVEVFPGQLEYQIGPNEGIRAGDEMWLSRYLLLRVAEMYGVGVSFAPKPILGDWNGSGTHTNFSTKSSRADGGLDVLVGYIQKLEPRHKVHIEVYGEDNDKRLTGKHETAAINTFRWGVGDRGASVRIPNDTQKAGKGYFEDRRPAGNIDPYVVSSMLVATTLLTGTESDRLYRRYKALHPRADYF